MNFSDPWIEKPPAKYVMAAALVAAALLVSRSEVSFLNERCSLMLLLLAVTATAWLAGSGPAAFATGSGVFGQLLLSAVGRGERPAPIPWPEICIFVLLGLAIAALAGGNRAVRRARRRAVSEAERIAEIVAAQGEPRTRDTSNRELNALNYEALVEAIPQVVWTSTPTGSIDFANRRWYEVSGLTPEQTMGTNWTSAIHPDDLGPTLERWTRALETGEPVEITWRLRTRDGRFRWQLARGAPVKDGGRALKWFGTLTDIEDQKQAEAVLREADRRKDEFLATLSHELRNPLAPIRNMLELLKREPDQNATTGQALSVIDRQLSQLVRLIDDLLDISRIGQGRIELRRERVELSSIVSQALETCRPLIESQRHKLQVTVPPQSVIVDGDPVRLAQVFGNLLHNACKYTPAGGIISFTVSIEGNVVVVSVKDNGIGIPANMLGPIFEMFTQAGHVPDRTREGLGIGLTLVRRFVEMHNGTVEARSEGTGRGSEFVVRLPIVVTSSGKPLLNVPERPKVDGLRVLVVDDNVDSAGSLALLLESYGYEARTAANGSLAIEMVESWHPRLLFCDLAMPGMDGYEVARRIRRQSAAGECLMVALTGYGSEADRLRTQAAGFDYHLVKPIDPRALYEILSQAAASTVDTAVQRV